LSLPNAPMMHQSLFLQVALFLPIASTFAFSSFQFPKLFAPLLPSPIDINTKISSQRQQQQEEILLDAVSNTQNGKSATISQQRNVLNLVYNLEKQYPCPPISALVSNEDTRQRLDGTWFLQYTSPSEIASESISDDENIEPSQQEKIATDTMWKVENAEDGITTQKYNAKGSVSAAGINVDVSKKPPKQIIDLSQTTVYNEVKLDQGMVRVGGTFRLSEKKDNRVVVSFQECKIHLNFGIKLDLGFLFKLRALIVGTDENGWLETTYLSDRVRIGRGNKGSMFVLTRDEGDVTP
jgi:PAP_fibrillin.